MKCIQCQEETSNSKFCSKSCSAQYTNKTHPKRKLEGNCRQCGVPISTRKPFCSKKCKTEHSLSIEQSPVRICTACGTEHPNTAEFFYAVRSRRTLSAECKKCFKSRISDRAKAQKLFCSTEKGGKCVVCGYQRYIGSLAFHHLDPSEKEFNFRDSCRSQDVLLKELEKCILVCSNCHGEIHGGLHPEYLIVKEL